MHVRVVAVGAAGLLLGALALQVWHQSGARAEEKPGSKQRVEH
jgi:hypothetical protein